LVVSTEEWLPWLQKRQWVQRVYFGNCIRQLERKLAGSGYVRRLTTTIVDICDAVTCCHQSFRGNF